MAKQYVVIGVSAGGIGALSKLRQLDPEATIIALSDEPEFPYNKCFLVDYISNAKTAEQIYTKTPSFFVDNRIDLRLGTKVVAINRTAKTVTCHDDSVIRYDALLLATGGSARMMHVDGSHHTAGIFPFYTYAQADTIKAWVQRSTTETIIVVGAGLSGLECADALLAYNKKIMVIDGANRPLPHHTTQKAGDYLVTALQKTGITFVAHDSVASVTSIDGLLSSVTLACGKTYQAQMLVWAIGAQPNTTLAQKAGLEIQQHAIVTNSYLQTADTSIFAVGDCALVTNLVTGKPVRSTTWPDAMMQGMIAATSMVGQMRPYAGVVPLLSSSFFGQKFYTGGSLEVNSEDIVKEGVTHEGYFFVRFDAKHTVLGFNLIGSVATYIVDLKRSLTQKTIYTGKILDLLP